MNTFSRIPRIKLVLIPPGEVATFAARFGMTVLELVDFYLRNGGAITDSGELWWWCEETDA
jgi:hypothetical protein